MKKETLIAYNKLVTEIATLQKDTKNDFYKSKYADLNKILTEVKQKICDNGFSFIQTIKENALYSALIWVEDGSIFMECELPLINAIDMQKLGSAITYARRYSLLPMLQLQCEDDDGNAAVGINAKQSIIKKETPIADRIKNGHNLIKELLDKLPAETDTSKYDNYMDINDLQTLQAMCKEIKALYNI